MFKALAWFSAGAVTATIIFAKVASAPSPEECWDFATEKVEAAAGWVKTKVSKGKPVEA
jgi:hypothetical protein